MRTMADNSIDAVVTDPPYGLHFMGKDWDHGIPGSHLWTEALRICKPGAMLLAFGGTRTYHRLTCAIEDAGWEIRDCLMWIYGSGFPKSMDIGKAIDKDNGKSKNLMEFCKIFDKLCNENNFTNKQIDEFLGLSSNGATCSHFRGFNNKQPRYPSIDHYHKLKKILKIPDCFDSFIHEAERKIIGQKRAGLSRGKICNFSGKEHFSITESATDLAKTFDGYGTALKPAYEPIILAMKPLDGTFAQNAEKWGVAGINIDECRIPIDITTEAQKNFRTTSAKCGGRSALPGESQRIESSPFIVDNHHPESLRHNAKGRWPANLILDEAAQC